MKIFRGGVRKQPPELGGAGDHGCSEHLSFLPMDATYGNGGEIGDLQGRHAPCATVVLIRPLWEIDLRTCETCGFGS